MFPNGNTAYFAVKCKGEPQSSADGLQHGFCCHVIAE